MTTVIASATCAWRGKSLLFVYVLLRRHAPSTVASSSRHIGGMERPKINAANERSARRRTSTPFQASATPNTYVSALTYFFSRTLPHLSPAAYQIRSHTRPHALKYLNVCTTTVLALEADRDILIIQELAISRTTTVTVRPESCISSVFSHVYTRHTVHHDQMHPFLRCRRIHPFFYDAWGGHTRESYPAPLESYDLLFRPI